MDHSDDPIIKNKKSAKFVLYELVSLDRLKFLRNWYVVTLILFIILILLLGWGGFTAGNTSTQSGGNSPVQGGDLITVNQVNNGYTVSFNKICNSGEILRWSDITSTWECSTETGGVSNTYTSGDGLDLANNQFSVDSPACTFNEKLSWTGTAFVCLPDLVGTGGGVDTDSQTLSLLGNSLTITNGNTVVLPSGVTLINTGNGLTGGPITTTGSISVNAPTCLVSERLSWDGTAFQCLPAALGAGITSINGEGGPAVTLNSTGPISVNTLANTVTYGLTACAINEVYMFDGVSWTCTVTTSLPLTNAFNLDQATGFTSTVNGVVANEALAAGTLTQILGFDVGGNPTFQSASAVVTAATTNVFTTAANVATSTVNGVVSFDDIINSNSLTATLATGFVSSVNGISSTQAIPAGTITNVFGFDVGGAPVNQTVASILSGSTTNAITWTQGAGVTTTVNGVAANVTPGAGVLTNILGYSVGGAPTFESVATVLSSNTTNTLVSAGNTMTSTVNGVASADDIINSNTFTVTQAGGFVSTVNGIAATQAVPAGTLSSLIGFDGGGAVVLQTLASLPCDPSGDFHCQGGNTFGATATTGTLDNQDYEVIANGVRSISVNAAIGTVGIGSHNPTLGILDIDGNVFIRAGGALGWYDSTTTNFVGFQAPAAVPSSFSWTLPATDGTLNQALVTDGASILGWATFLSNAITSINTTATGPNVDLLGTAGQIDITTLGNNVTFSLDPDIVCPGSTTTFCQNGNTFATNGVLGTNDNFDLVLERNNISTAFVSATGFDPMIDNTFDLGTLANRWASLELGPGSLNITSTPGVAGAGANYSSLNQGYPTLDSAVIHTTNFGTNTVGNFGGLTFLSDKNTGLGIQQAFYFSTKQNLAANDEVFQVENDFLGTPDPLFTIMGDGRTGVVNTTPSAMLTVGGGTTGLTGTAGVALIGVAGSPALSVIDEGRIYFDATTDTFRCSENTGAYFDCFGTGVTSLNGESGALTIAGSSPITVSNVGPAFTVALAACATGEVYEYDGANWVCVEESLQYYDESPNAPGVAPSASGTNAVAIGDSATASGNFATAIGWVSTAAGFRSQAFGMANTVGATGTNSHAFGFNNTIDAFDTISVGWSNTSTGAVGENNLFGRSNTASGSQSSLFGTGNASTLGFNNQYAFGRNITNSASNTYSYGNGVNNTVADSLMIGSTAANVITILNTGEMGFGNTDPTSRVDISGAMTMRGMATPALSPLGQGRVYFDSTANEFLCSENNGAYFDCFGGGVQTVTAGLGIINSGTVTNPILDVQVQNGLTIVGDFVEWGGTLLHDTTITNSGFLPTFDSGSLTGTKGLEIIGDLTVTGVIDPIAVMFSDPGIGVLDYQIGITNPANSRPIFVSNSVDRTDAFQVRRSDDTATVLDVDTLNNRVGVGYNNFATHSTLSTNGSFSVNYEDSSGG